MEKETISLEHQALLEPRLRKLGLDLIDYTFTNLYLFREIHAFELVQKGDLCIIGMTRDGVRYLMPLAPPSEIDWKDLWVGLAKNEVLFPIPEEWLPHLEGNGYERSQAEMDSDYLYQTSKFAHYPGRKLSSRRNLVHQFLDHYSNHATHPLTEERADDALRILEEWGSHPHGDPSFTDYVPCKESIQLLNRLHLQGRITYVEGEPAGFIIGEPLNAHTFVFHMAKGLTRYKGIYQYIFEEWAQLLEPDYAWINLGQDIGSEDIRHSKRSYQPDRLLTKWRIKKNTGTE
ncbi:MAG: phosphatidylglycerol lysyltransferase domain-containing protein [Parachlamydia sp.]|nr:phosphatidylglycerol lysyltransferase domain-containing protein [Parachlamydia sp.]